MKIYLMRHGQTNWNLTWRLQGRTDIELNEKGLRQAQEAATRYKDIQFDLALSSPLSRARKTAEMIVQSYNLPVIIDERLTEMSFGKHEGMTEETEPDKEGRRILFEDPENYIPVDGAEGYKELDLRCKEFVEYIADLEGQYNNILIVSHGACCKGIIRAILNADLKDFWEMPLLTNCQALEIKVENGVFVLPEEYDKYDKRYF